MLAPLLYPIFFSAPAAVPTLAVSGPSGAVATGGTDSVPSVAQNATLTRTYSLSNVGGANLSVFGLAYDASLTVSGPGVINGQLNKVLTPGQSATLVVAVSTVNAGSYSRQLLVATNDPTGAYSFSLVGTVTAPNTTLDPADVRAGLSYTIDGVTRVGTLEGTGLTAQQVQDAVSNIVIDGDKTLGTVLKELYAVDLGPAVGPPPSAEQAITVKDQSGADLLTVTVGTDGVRTVEAP